MFRRFLRNARGAVLPTFAIAALPLIAASGAAVDYARSFDERQTVQDALDSAVLAAGKKIGLMIMSSDADFTLHPSPGTELTVDLDASSISIPVVGGQMAFDAAVAGQ